MSARSATRPVLYLNHAGTSWPKPEPVLDAVADEMAASAEDWSGRLSAHHDAVSAALGIADPDRLRITPGATSALAVGIGDVLPWEAGDRVIVSGLEHHALDRAVRSLEARGVERVVAPRAPGEPIVLEAVEAALGEGRVRLLAFTAACNVTGELLPTAELIALAKRYGARTLVDAAQVAGWLPLAVDALGADLVAFAGHKGPQAPWGVGGLYVAPGLPIPGYCDVGSVDRGALAGLAAGFAWLADPARADRLARGRAAAAVLWQRLEEMHGVALHGPPKPDARMPTVAMTAEGRDPERLAAGLAERGVIASGGRQCAMLAHETLGTAPGGVLRLSFGPEASEAQAAEAGQALREVLAAP